MSLVCSVYNLLRTNHRVVRENHLRDRSDALHCRFRREQNMLCEISHPSASHRIMLSNGDSQKLCQDLSHSISINKRRCTSVCLSVHPSVLLEDLLFEMPFGFLSLSRWIVTNIWGCDKANFIHKALGPKSVPIILVSNISLTYRYHSHCSVYECPQVDIY